MAQRLVRAKRKIAAAGIPYRVPEAHELPDRLAGVLRVVYLVFREGYAPSAGPALVRPELCAEAIRLARLVVALLPDEGEALGLLGMLLLHDSRRSARTDAVGDLVPLGEQDRRRWDRAAIREGAALAAGALRRGGCPTPCRRGSPPATRRRRLPPTWTGRRSRPCTASWPGWTRRRRWR